ncbi:MAG: ATP-binding protein [Paludibacteraceae bacterium]|nr:ATP-binding protein [Paludibacteraceae bacterium]
MSSDLVKLKLHPRGIEALGKDLVTNNVVAIIELVKNSYDAFATQVRIIFGRDDDGDYLEICDDGEGMPESLIKNVWAIVATPYKSQNPFIEKNKKKRRVTGEKGLGRLSIARLGGIAVIATKTKNELNEIVIDWEHIFSQKSLNDCSFKLNKTSNVNIIGETGTTIRIRNLHDKWTENDIAELEENLSRVLSPFSKEQRFGIFLQRPNELSGIQTKIEKPKFIDFPKYRIFGRFCRKSKKIEYTYVYTDYVNDKKNRVKQDCYTWELFYSDFSDRNKDNDKIDSQIPSVGDFTFEIRVWDIKSTELQDVAEKFKIEKKMISKAIRAHKGLSLYRDDILVLPKTDNSRDWLGLDLRRVSRIGTRISTSQMVGYVSINADTNPKIKDASDREKLVRNKESFEFEELLFKIIQLLETERNIDKETDEPSETGLEDLFKDLETDDIIQTIEELAASGGSSEEAIPLLREFQNIVDKTREKIQERFIYYSRLATVGTIAQYLVHEIRNRTTVIGALIKSLKEEIENQSEKTRKYLALSEESVQNLERLADTFAPLANRSFSNHKRNSNLMEQIENCLIYLLCSMTKRN